MADITLYTNPMSRGRIARWMLEETGVDYSTVLVEFGRNDPGYRAVNPLGKVPAIVHGGSVVTECAAICAYLADAFPDAGLAPAASDRADYYRWLFFGAGPIEAAVTNKALGVVVPDERRAMVGYGDIDVMMDALAEAVSQTPYICGDRFTAADVYIGSHIGWGLQFGTFPSRPEFVSYAQKLQERDAAKRAAEKDDALMTEMQAAS